MNGGAISINIHVPTTQAYFLSPHSSQVQSASEEYVPGVVFGLFCYIQRKGNACGITFTEGRLSAAGRKLASVMNPIEHARRISW